MRLLRRRRPDPDKVSDAVSAALGQPVVFNHLQYRAGALSGTIDVPDTAGFERALRTAYETVVEVLGEDAERVVFYLSGSTPDVEPVTPAALGLPVPPSGHDLAKKYR